MTSSNPLEVGLGCGKRRQRTRTGSPSIVATRLHVDVVRWVGVDHMDGSAIEQPVQVFGLAGVATE